MVRIMVPGFRCGPMALRGRYRGRRRTGFLYVSTVASHVMLGMHCSRRLLHETPELVAGCREQELFSKTCRKYTVCV